MSQKWKMPKPCCDCPFDGPDGEIAHERVADRDMENFIVGIHRLINGGSFTCHKTLKRFGGDDKYLCCAGSLRWQDIHGIERSASAFPIELHAELGLKTKEGD